MASKNVEDVYPLSPIQEGMLFHALYEPGTGIYVSQVACVFEGLRAAAFVAAWQQVVDRHTALRTAFVWKTTERPLQVVAKRVTLAWTEQDWRHLDPGERQGRIDEYLERDRLREFQLSRAPLMAFSLLRIGEERHQFVWTHHHLLIDGWSVSLVMREVLTICAGRLSGGEARLDRARPYRAYIEWLQRQDMAAAESFWRSSLAGFTVPTPLVDDGGSGHPGAGHGQVRLQLPAAATAAIHTFARQQGLTLNTLLQGAWALLLARSGGQQDVIFGAVNSGRPPELRGIEGIVGVFINTLPVRVKVGEESILLDWLRRLQAEQAEAREFEYSPLARIQEWSDIPLGTPLFETLFVLESYPMAESPLNGGASFRITDLRVSEISNYPLALVVAPGARLSLKALFDRQRLAPATARRLLEQFAAVLAAFAGAPGAPLALVPAMMAAERHQVVVEWNDTAREYPGESTVHGLFEEQARRRPDTVAIEAGGERLTYAALERRANRLARHLRRFGVGPDVLVGMAVERSIEMIVALLAILKAGGAYLPLDPTLPEQRLHLLLEEARVAAVLVRGGSLLATGSRGARRIDLEACRQEIAGEDAGPLDVEVVSDNLVWVIYTSGSTGRPKGVAVPHRAAIRLVRNTDYAEFGPAETLLQFAPVFFDASAIEIWGALLNGGRLVLPEPGLHSLAELGRIIRESAVTTLWLTAGLFHQMVDERLTDLAGLRQWLAGGDALSAPHVRRAIAGLPGCRVIDGYGPTEDGVLTCCHTATRESVASRMPIGRAIANTTVHLLDAERRPVPIGVDGELCAGGDGLARGYFGRPDLTAERFVPDPLATLPGARLYRTGDLVRRRSEGTIDFLGRIDRQVKIRGVRIEPGEIEAALIEQPELQESLIVVDRSIPSDPRLIAYVVPRPGVEIQMDKLKAQLATRLPAYMVPGLFVVLPRLPLTRNGKIDRAALPVPETQRRTVQLALRSPVEEVLGGLWSDLLRVSEVGPEDDFFALGGHSLLAVRMISRLRQIFGVELPLRSLFESSTVGALALTLEEAIRGGQVAGWPPLEPAPRGVPLPLSPAQQRLWMMQRLYPGNADYNVPQALRLTGDLDLGALSWTLSEITRRHQALRTSFVVVDGEPAQVVTPAVGKWIPQADLTALPPHLRRLELDRLLAHELERPFDLTAGAPLRVLVAALAAGEHVLLFVAHHIVCDAWSMSILLREVSALYQAAVDGAPAPLPELSLQFADFAVWHRSWLLGGELERQLAYWRRQLAGCPPALQLPADRPRNPAVIAQGGTLRFTVDAETCSALKLHARQGGATLFMVLLAAYEAMLQRYSGQTDFAVGVPVAGRNRREVEDLIGFFVNSLVMRADLTGDPTFRELLARVRDTALGAYAHQEVPFDVLVEELQPVRLPGCGPFFQVTCMLLNTPRAHLSLEGLVLEPLELENRRLRSDLQLQFLEVPTGLLGSFHYNASLFEREPIEEMGDRFRALLAGVARDPEKRLSEYQLLDERESEALAASFNEDLEDA